MSHLRKEESNSLSIWKKKTAGYLFSGILWALDFPKYQIELQLFEDFMGRTEKHVLLS